MMKKVIINTVKTAILSVAFISCGSQGDGQVVKGNAEKSETSNSPLKGAIIKNDIEIEATGVKVKAAYLMTEDAQFKLTNTAKTGERIFLTIELDTGWMKVNGKSFIGATEQIIDQSGKIILDTEDLFSNVEKEGLDMEVAKNINLSAIIDSFEPGLDTFTVKYKIWDKKGKGMVKGSYKFKVEN